MPKSGFLILEINCSVLAVPTVRAPRYYTLGLQVVAQVDMFDFGNTALQMVAVDTLRLEGPG
jgi:hypothetical protein